MNALHDETRARWGAHDPQEFINTVLHGALRQKLDVTSIVIHVYAQIVHQFADSASLMVQPLGDGGQPAICLRDVFLNMRTAISNAQTAAGDTVSLGTVTTSPEFYILHLTGDVGHYIDNLERNARMIEIDGTVRVMRLPGAKGKTFAEVAREVLVHVSEIKQLLDFAHMYAEKRGNETPTQPDTT